jgi:hypothetical protein
VRDKRAEIGTMMIMMVTQKDKQSEGISLGDKSLAYVVMIRVEDTKEEENSEDQREKEQNNSLYVFALTGRLL